MSFKKDWLAVKIDQTYQESKINMAKGPSRYRDIPRHVTVIARKLRQDMTECERKIWDKLSNRKLNGLKFRRQHPIGRYVADFYNHEKRLIIEIDGVVHEERQEYDCNRDKHLEACGYHILRISNDNVINNIDAVIDLIRTTTAKR